MNAKIREAQTQKIPYMLVVGDQEVQNQQVSLRKRSGENPGAIGLEEFLRLAQAEIEAGA
jgi:threonyl-tRNA synthetase